MKISEIQIDGEYRKYLGDVDSLARESIESIGLLHPIVVDSSKRLICGRRRIEAYKQL